MDPRRYKNPEEFCPERFASFPLSSSEYINRSDSIVRDHFTFGAGRRSVSHCALPLTVWLLTKYASGSALDLLSPTWISSSRSQRSSGRLIYPHPTAFRSTPILKQRSRVRTYGDRYPSSLTSPRGVRQERGR